MKRGAMYVGKSVSSEDLPVKDVLAAVSASSHSGWSSRARETRYPKGRNAPDRGEWSHRSCIIQTSSTENIVTSTTIAKWDARKGV